MRHLSFLALICIFVMMPAQNPEYQLRIPTAAQYLEAVPEILESIESERANYTDNFRAFWETIRFELENREWNFNNVSFDVLNHAYHTLPIAVPYSEPNNPAVWQERLITAWLRENDVGLSAQDELRFENYTIIITLVDFNNDGVDELLLDITLTGEDGHKDFAAFWVMEQDEASSIGYRRMQTPPLWFSANCDLRSLCGGAAQILNLEDVNADELVEWIVAVGSYCGYGECGGHLLILGWRNGEIVELAQRNDFYDLFWTGASSGGRSPLLPPEGTWTFQNVDNDAAQELIQRRHYSDNRDCIVTNLRIFDWNSVQDAYISGEITIAYADTSACALRQGQAAMKEGSYDAAIAFYLQAIELLPIDGDDYEREARQYAQIRLVVAYALNGQEEEANALLTELHTQLPESEIMGNLINAMDDYPTNHDAVELCAGVFNAVQEFNIYSDDSFFWNFGQTDDVPGRPQTYVGGDFSAANSGCNLPGLLDYPSVNFHSEQQPSPDTQADQNPFNCYAPYDFCGFARSDDSALELMSEVLANPPVGTDPSFLLAVHYRRALILELLGRPDEALADYIFIYEAAPESAWGMLAALHLEIE